MTRAGVTENPERSDESSDDDSMSVSNSRTHSRKELKQLDREIPWRQLTDLPKPQLDAYLEATRVENDNWMAWGGIQPISHREAKGILADAKLSRRILKSRAAYRDKSKGIGPLRPKCRVVIIGCADPDLFQISRDSPTPTRLSEALLMTIAAAGVNKEFNNTNEQWYLWASDAKSAFLQGDQDASERRRATLHEAPTGSADRGHGKLSHRAVPGDGQLLWPAERTKGLVLESTQDHD